MFLSLINFWVTLSFDNQSFISKTFTIVVVHVSKQQHELYRKQRGTRKKIIFILLYTERNGSDFIRRCIVNYITHSLLIIYITFRNDLLCVTEVWPT
jgi:hypothetical protein